MEVQLGVKKTWWKKSNFLPQVDSPRWQSGDFRLDKFEALAQFIRVPNGHWVDTRLYDNAVTFSTLRVSHASCPGSNIWNISTYFRRFYRVFMPFGLYNLYRACEKLKSGKEGAIWRCFQLSLNISNFSIFLGCLMFGVILVGYLWSNVARSLKVLWNLFRGSITSFILYLSGTLLQLKL